MNKLPAIFLILLILLVIAPEEAVRPALAQADETLKIRPDVELTDDGEQAAPSSHRLTLLSGYCIAIVLASILGGYLPSRLKLTHTRMQILMSFVGGLMLGVALFHLLLHAVYDSPKEDLPFVMAGVALGIMVMFLLLRTFHFHQHDFTPNSVDAVHAHEDGACGHEHNVPAIQPEKSDKSPENPQSSRRMYSWIGIALGLGLHTVLDGVALTASCLRSSADAGGPQIWGLATFLAILLHKPLDAISITTVMTATGWSRSWCTLVNVSFALMCPFGALLAWWGLVGMHSQIEIVAWLLAFSAGVFLCIALSDLLPEMQFHAHNQWGLTTSLLAGIILAAALMFLDPVHRF